jgi:hypothetical protein
VRPPTETSPSTPPAPEEPVAQVAEEKPKLSMSTAPESLPPPTEKQAAVSGPPAVRSADGVGRGPPALLLQELQDVLLTTAAGRRAARAGRGRTLRARRAA